MKQFLLLLCFWRCWGSNPGPCTQTRQCLATEPHLQLWPTEPHLQLWHTYLDSLSGAGHGTQRWRPCLSGVRTLALMPRRSHSKGTEHANICILFLLKKCNLSNKPGFGTKLLLWFSIIVCTSICVFVVYMRTCVRAAFVDISWLPYF